MGDVGPGDRYRYRLHRGGEDPVDRADPASRWQPDGLHGPSAVDDPRFAWTDAAWRGRPLRDQVLYELHVGTFTPEGTFDAIVPRLADLAELGVTTIELMPIWQFPGERNWGYDGVLPYAPQHSYGGPAGLRRLVDAAHAAGIGVVLDVVYNHYGPEGNHLADFGPYLTDRYDTPWGQAVNVDGPGADEVRRYAVENAVRWVRDFHVDGLRLDAVHAIVDTSAVHLLEELTRAVHAEAARAGRHGPGHRRERSRRPAARPRTRAVGGYGLDGQWLDDVHHALHVALTGRADRLLRGLRRARRPRRAACVTGSRTPAGTPRTAGGPSAARRRDVAYERFVVCTQNHDQVGNRMLGERQTALLDLEQPQGVGRRAAAVAVHADALDGAGARRDRPVPVLRVAHRPGPRRGGAGPVGGASSPTSPTRARRPTRRPRRPSSARRWTGPCASEGEHATLARAVPRRCCGCGGSCRRSATAEAGDAEPTVHGPHTVAFTRGVAGRPDTDILVVVHAG